ncbi:MAG: ATP-dependent Clp protease ATP-binding subunit [Patescibacteria group bacterium]
MADPRTNAVELLAQRPNIFRAVRLEAVIPRSLRRNALAAFFFLFILLGALSLIVSFMGTLAFSAVATASASRFLIGLTLLCASPFLFFLVAEFYFLTTSRDEPLWKASLPDGEKLFLCNFGAARRLWQLGALDGKEAPITRLYDSFSVGRFAKQFFMRLGIPREAVLEFANTRNTALSIPQELLFQMLVYEAIESRANTVTAREFILLLFDVDKEFEEFLFRYEIRKEDAIGAANWVSDLFQLEQARLQWWERAVLGRMPTFGASLIFGYTYTLDQYARDISAGSQGAIIPRGFIHGKELDEMAQILARNAQANVILVGDPGIGKMSLLEQLARLILEGQAPSALWEKRLIAVDTMALTATAKNKGDLEALLIKVMNEAAGAGNVVLVLEKLPEFIDSASYLGVNAISLLEPYLEGTELQVVALSDLEQYHRVLERNAVVTKLFEKVELAEPERIAAVYVLEEVVYNLEKKYPVIVTYPALLAAADLAERYISEGAMPEKAVDLLERGITEAAGNKEYLVEKRHIEKAVEERTHIPVHKAEGAEAKELLHMEEFLHKRVIGQEAAITAIANTMRRARAGLHAGKRPIGSFLFLGPTGVGKTETAKALAAVYFKSEEAMARFDMSEFQGPDGVNKLIGSFGAGETGALANALREKPFGLLLFDEFEKSSRDVINLFLQILEEGFFADSKGKRVFARDSIIIATSNAGSNLIWDLVQQGKDPASLQKDVVEAIHREGIFAPEILNRFDAIIVFEPLGKEKLTLVAHLLLEELAERLKKQDVDFIITDELVARVVEIGYDPVMGARPMRRAIADRIEQIIARKLLDGSLVRGQSLQFTPEEIKGL